MTSNAPLLGAQTAAPHGQLPTKLCTKCGEKKPIGDFGAKGGGRKGLRARCRTCSSEDRRRYAPPPKNPLRQSLASAKVRAKKLGLPFDLRLEDIPLPDRCPVLGTEWVRGTKKPHPQAPSLDRIEPGKGYVPGNVIWVSFRANAIKNNASPDELRRVADFYESW